MIRLLARSSILLVGLAACVGGPPQGRAPTPVFVGGGMGPGGYETYEAERLARERELAGYGLPGAVPSASAAAPYGSPPGGAPGASAAISADELRAAGLPAGSEGAGLPPVEPVPTRSIDEAFDRATGNTPPPRSDPLPAPQSQALPGVNNPAISDEQSFAAVSSRETIESDAERLARQRAAYQVIEPEAVPQRTGRSGPNIVQFALSTSNAVGERIYSRRGLFAERRFRAACAKFASPDLAQEAFLRAGGPETDRLGVDPDGDGFACGWNPAPFRAAKG